MDDEPDLGSYVLLGLALGLLCLTAYVGLVPEDRRSLLEWRAWVLVDSLLSGLFWGGK